MRENRNADREHFERWYCGALVTQGAREIERNAQGDYILMQTRLAWQAWHAGWVERGALGVKAAPECKHPPCTMPNSCKLDGSCIAARCVPSDCETCGGVGTIDERLGGYSFSNPAATCPDCDGTGEGPCGVTTCEALRLDVDAMLAACVPGGSICDPQQVADAIRAYFARGVKGLGHGR